MNKILTTHFPERNIFTKRLVELRTNFQARLPNHLALSTGSSWISLDSDAGEFRFEFWNKSVLLSYPDGEAFPLSGNSKLSDIDQTLILYYFLTADETKLSENWISFADLKDGRFYNQAFQSYSGREITVAFQDNVDQFKESASKLGGLDGSLGDASFRFQVLPKVPLMVVYWLGDEDFPSSSQILFDSHANHFLPTDAYAILGSMLTRKLVASKKLS